jgi:hypothetical protein
MTWSEVLVWIWCLFMPGIASFWGYKAGYKECCEAEKRRMAIRNECSIHEKNNTEY